MKKWAFLLLFMVVLNVLAAGAAWGSPGERLVLRFFIGESDYSINGESGTMDTVPVIKEGRTMLPIRFVADALGAEVGWDKGERKVTVTLEDTEVELWIDESIARVNGIEQMIDPDNPEVKPLLLPPGRTVLPLRFISENLGCQVDWSPARGEVTVHYPVNLELRKKAFLRIEGMEEEVGLNLQVSTSLPYAIYVDKERYRMEKGAERDSILPLWEVDPEVFMSIQHREEVAVSALAAEIEEELREKYAEANIYREGHVEKPLPSYHLYAVNAEAWNDAVERYYLVEDFEGGAFVIRQKLFAEAVEGHGTRFNGMLEEFFTWNAERRGYFAPGSISNSNEDGNGSGTNCWDYQPTDMAPKPGWDTVDLEGLTRQDLVDVLGCPPHVIRMTSVVSGAHNRELWVYHPYEEDPTGLYIWLKGDVFHHSTLNEFNGFWCYGMMDLDFWESPR